MPFEPTTLSWLTIIALIVALLALAFAVLAWQRANASPGTPRRRGQSSRQDTDPRRYTTEEIAAEVEALKVSTGTSLRHLAVVRYDAFGDMGGHLSWSMALLDDSGDGVVLTSIHGRSDARTYAKNVSGWSANQQLSPEEEEAINYARSVRD